MEHAMIAALATTRLRNGLGLTGTAALALGLAAPSADAQYRQAPPPAAYALEEVTVVQADGSRMEEVTLVIRGGMLEAVGSEVEVPSDARILEGESLHVYPGLVDPYGQAPMDIPSPDRDGVRPWTPTREVQRFTPHRTAAEVLTATGEELGGAREAGIVASAVFPGPGMMPGRGAVLLHRVGTDRASDLVMRSPFGASLRLQGAQGAYPGTLFGTMAFLRQVFLDAERHGVSLVEHERDPSGMRAPGLDPDYEVVRKLARGELPVFVRADDAVEIRRVLDLATELGFVPVIVGGEGAWKVADLLRERDVPVVVSADFPEPSDWDPEEEGEQEPAAERERKELEALYANAGLLREAGVRVAFATLEGAGDLREAARKAVEYGLSPDEALRALTAEPAQLLGVGHLAAVAEGHGATFVVTEGPLLEEDTRIAYTFVEGSPTEGAGAGPGLEATDEPPAGFGGSWDVRIEAEGMTIPAPLTLEQDGASFTGSLEAEALGGARVRNGRVARSSFSFEIEVEGFSEPLRVTGEVDDGRMRGSGQGPEMMGASRFTGRRSPGTDLHFEGALR